MEKISSFIVNNWQYISFALIVFIDVLILILKRVKLSFKFPDSSVNFIIDKISEAEKTYGVGHGREKLNYVVQAYMNQYNVAKYFEQSVRYYVSDKVEEILNTPTKKGGLGREEIVEEKI